MQIIEDIQILEIDLFCGAGGVTTGTELATIDGKKIAKVIACVNHDPIAIESHSANHKGVYHFTEDVRTLNLSELKAIVAKFKLLYPDAKTLLHASLECTNFSKAKGGMPREADSRTLADALDRYVIALCPDIISIENVEEFMSWGPLDNNGKPVSKTKGTDYLKWKQRIQNFGYDFDYRIINSANFGAYTSRKRFFAQFVKFGLPMSWPEPTHSKNGSSDMFGNTKKWKPVKDVLDLNDEGESIFTRKKPIVDKTLERIYAGLIKFVAGGKDVFLVKWNSMSATGKYNAPGIEDPCPVVSCQNRLGVAKVNFLSKQFSGKPDSKNISIERPAGAITTIDHHALVGAKFLSKYYSGHPESMISSLDNPSAVIRTKDCQSIVSPKFLSAYHGNGGNAHSIEGPAPTIPTHDSVAVVSTNFIDKQYGSGKHNHQSVLSPAGALTGCPKLNLVTCKPWILNPQFKSSGGSIEKPCFTLIARMDKAPPYLVTPEIGNIKIKIEASDSEIMIKIKQFMVLYEIYDIKMRMLKIVELKLIMGFASDYILRGTQTDQKKHIGNAVEVQTYKAIIEAAAQGLMNKSELQLTA